MIRKLALPLALGVSTFAMPLPAMAQATEAVAVDPARLKLAEQTVAKLVPPGTYSKIMKDMMDQMAGGLVEQMMGMDAATLAKASGTEAGATDTVTGKTLGELAAEKDPHFKERMDITMRVMFAEMGMLMNDMEPVVRDALAKIYARKYSAKELADMNAFFATPSGASFAGNFMGTFTDKEMVNASFGMMPKILEAMPAIMEKVEKATAHLPPAPNSAATAEMIPECSLDDDNSDCSAEDMAKLAEIAASEAAAQAAAAGEEAELRAAWNKTDLRAVEKIEADRAKLWARYDEAEAALGDTEIKLQQAIDTAKRNAGQPTDQVMAAEDIPDNAVPPPALPK